MNVRMRKIGGFAAACILAATLTSAGPARADTVDFNNTSLDQTIQWLKENIVKYGEFNDPGKYKSEAYTDVEYDGATLTIRAELTRQDAPNADIAIHKEWAIPLAQVSERDLLAKAWNTMPAHIRLLLPQKAGTIKITESSSSQPGQTKTASSGELEIWFTQNPQVLSNVSNALHHAVDMAQPGYVNFADATFDQTIEWLKGAITQYANFTRGPRSPFIKSAFVDVAHEGNTLGVMFDLLRERPDSGTVTERHVLYIPLQSIDFSLMQTDDPYMVNLNIVMEGKRRLIKQTTQYSDPSISATPDIYSPVCSLPFPGQHQVARNVAAALQHAATLAN